jgi:hypothetical protein
MAGNRRHHRLLQVKGDIPAILVTAFFLISSVEHY